MNITTFYRRIVCAIFGHDMTAFRKVVGLPERRARCIHCGEVETIPLTREQVIEYAKRNNQLRMARERAASSLAEVRRNNQIRKADQRAASSLADVRNIRQETEESGPEVPPAA